MAGGDAVSSWAVGYGAGRGSTLPQWNTFVLGRIIRPNQRGRGPLDPASASGRRELAMGSPARRIAWRRTSCRRYCPAVLIVLGTDANRVIADTLGMHPQPLRFRDHRI